MYLRKMEKINGTGVSPGISIGKAFVVKKAETAFSGIVLTTEAEIIEEIAAFNTSVVLALNEIETIKADSELSLQEDALAILEAQIELISDPQIAEDVIEKIKSERKKANHSLAEVIANLVLVFEAMDDEYMQARAADIKDIGNRILGHLNKQLKQPAKFKQDTIIIADDISPSDTIAMDIKHVIGFATRAGSKTSHAAIIAKAKGIPAVVGCGEELLTMQNDDVVILDGKKGLVYINPDDQLIKDYQIKREEQIRQAEKLKALKDAAAITTDGERIVLSANISGADDMEGVHDNGGEGVGLFRTELLFMNRDSFPTEDEQFGFYKQVALQSKGKPIIVRTIDIGGDKQLPYFNIPNELNPFLGYRAIRICLDQTALFITQLKAILRATVFGDLKIMFPMISGIQEIRAAKKILREAKEALSAANVPFKAGIEVGIMIEIPSAAVTADILAKEVDFFSIGTNDLCQYTLAVDRVNEKITHLYDPFNPGVLRLIENVIVQAKKYQIHVGMCGEMAGDPMATLLLLGMGLEGFSMSASSIPAIKNIIINSSKAKAKLIYQKVMGMDNSEEIIAYLKTQTE
jgi:phosphotransferase system enzyme I (PtsI)